MHEPIGHLPNLCGVGDDIGRLRGRAAQNSQQQEESKMTTHIFKDVSFRWRSSQAEIAEPLSDKARTVLVFLALVLLVAVQAIICPRALVKPFDTHGGHVVKLAGTVVDVPRRPYAGEIRFPFETKIEGKPVKLLLSAPDLPWDENTQVRIGDHLRGQVRLWSIIRGAEDRSPFSYASYLRRRGIQARGKFVKHLKRTPGDIPLSFREEFVSKLAHLFPSGDAIGTLLAMNIAEEDLLSTETRELFRRTGTSHLLVVSGFHVSFIFLILFQLLRRLFVRSYWLVSRVPVEIPAACIAFGVSTLFVAFIGWTLPALRALVFLVVFALAKILARRALTLRTLFLAFIAIFLIWPGSFFEVSAQLTFAAILGLLVGVRLCARIHGSDMLAKFKKALLLNSVVWCFTSPVIWLWFENFVPLGVFWNLLIVAAFSVVGISLGGAALVWFAIHAPFSRELLEFTLFVLDRLLYLLERAEALTQGTVWQFIEKNFG